MRAQSKRRVVDGPSAANKGGGPMTWRTRLARWLAPEMARDSDDYYRIWHHIDDLRWWHGNEFKQVSAAAQYLIDRIRWWRHSTSPEPNEYPWSPPGWVNTVDQFRQWLRDTATSVALPRHREMSALGAHEQNTSEQPK